MADAFPGQTFQRPVNVVSDGTDMLYVVQQSGQVFQVPKLRAQGQQQPKRLWLDLSRVCWHKDQGGLLDLAFHPQYATNGRFFVSYTAANQGNAQMPAKMVIAAFRASGGRADPNSQQVLLPDPQEDELAPRGRHLLRRRRTPLYLHG